jgi:hypothetical protein
MRLSMSQPRMKIERRARPRGCAHGREVGGAVHQEGHARGGRELPAVPSRLE